MVNRLQFYIDGAWVDPAVKKSTPVVNPATEEAMYEVALGSKADVDKAVAAARRAFETFSQTSREERVALLSKIIEIYKGRMKDIGALTSRVGIWAALRGVQREEAINILRQEGVKEIDDDAFDLIWRATGGSMRRLMAVAELLVAKHAGKPVTEHTVAGVAQNLWGLNLQSPRAAA